MTGYARLPPFRGRAGPPGAGPRKPPALAFAPIVIQELAAVSESHHSEELPHSLYLFPIPKGPPPPFPLFLEETLSLTLTSLRRGCAGRWNLRRARGACSVV